MTPELFKTVYANKIETVQDLINELEKVQNKNAAVRAYFDPDEFLESEQAEISMISCVDDSFGGDRVDINLFQFQPQP